MKKLFFVFVVTFISLFSFINAQPTLLHSFQGSPSDGKWPYWSDLTQDGNTLYGVTGYGGGANGSLDGYGTIYKINKDGTENSLLHSFTSEESDGNTAFSTLIQDGNTLYGMTLGGGAKKGGTIYKIRKDGTLFTLLHSFNYGSTTNGAYPFGSLVLYGNYLYGMTNRGGTYDLGTIFKIMTDGTGFTILHSFASGISDGANPYGSLLMDGSTLYGMTYSGGANKYGTVFKIMTDATGFSLMHSFASGVSDGAYPFGSLIQNGNYLYGMTYSGGANDLGTIFKIKNDDTDFTLMHSFLGAPSDGAHPYGSLLMNGRNLYGMTNNGGSGDGKSRSVKVSTGNIGSPSIDIAPLNDNKQLGKPSINGYGGAGTIFNIKTDGTGYTLLHSFLGGPSDGANPYGNLITDSGTLYGLTPHGGANKFGTIFKLSLPSVFISGYARDGDGNAVPGVDVSFSNGGATVSTDVNGRYVTSVSAGWHGTSTASMAGHTFAPPTYDYTPLYSNQMDQDFTVTQLPLSLFISGYVRDLNNQGIEGVAVSFSNGGAMVYTNSTGHYSTSVSYGWNGTATPSMGGNMRFTPSSMDYPPVVAHQTDQDYFGAQKSLLMTGFVRDADGVGINSVAVTFSNGGATVYTDETGEYAGSVASGWNGTATPSKDGYSFWPPQYTYPMHLTSDQLGQDITAMMSEEAKTNETSILPAYPNPFNPSTTITYGLGNDGKVSINIYDISGRLITNLVEGEQKQGIHSTIWNGTNQNGENVPAGMYLSILKTSNDVKTTKLMLLK